MTKNKSNHKKKKSKGSPTKVHNENSPMRLPTEPPVDPTEAPAKGTAVAATAAGTGTNGGASRGVPNKTKKKQGSNGKKNGNGRPKPTVDPTNASESASAKRTSTAPPPHPRVGRPAYDDADEYEDYIIAPLGLMDRLLLASIFGLGGLFGMREPEEVLEDIVLHEVGRMPMPGGGGHGGRGGDGGDGAGNGCGAFIEAIDE